MRTTVMRISERALYNNARVIRASLPDGVQMMCVVKANAYGHGSVDAARTFLRAGADAFSVAIAEEAVELREGGINAPILVLGGADASGLRDAARCNAAHAVYDTWMLDVLQQEARKLGRDVYAHLKIDSGMSRIGVRDPAALIGLLDHWKNHCPNVIMQGLFTHFCVAESDPEFTAIQDAHFRAARALVHAQGFTPILHAAATSAMEQAELQYDMIRAGIGLYGTCAPGLEGKLEYAQTLTARPVRLQTIQEGDSVGYGRSFVAQRKTRIMTVPIGYGDGYLRVLGKGASALVCGRRAPIAGNVCMDMLMLDVSDIPEASLESEVVLLGAQGKERITPDELATISGTIPYEIMLSFSPRVRRIYDSMDA